MALTTLKAITLFPLLLPVWEQRPFVREDIYPGNYPVFVTPAEVELQREALRLADGDLRIHIIRELRRSKIEEGFRVLLDHAAAEADPLVRATLLQNLATSRFGDPKLLPLARTAMTAPGEDMRYWGIRLMGTCPEPDFEALINLLQNETSQMLREAAANVLRDGWRRGKLALYEKLLKDPNPRIRAAAATAACHKAAIAERHSFLVKAAREDEPVIRRALVRELAALPETIRGKLVPIFLADPHATTRAELALKLGRLAEARFLDTLLALMDDPDPEVRRLAAKSLAVFPGAPARKRLVAHIADDRTLVRRQVEESLVRIHAREPVAAAVSAMLNAPKAYSRYHAYRILGRLNSREYAQRIHTGLRREKKPVNVAAAVFALGQFEAAFAAEDVQRLASHTDPGVREGVGRTLGQLRVPKTYGTIKTLAFDKEETVRHAAIISMGWIGDGNVFNKTIFKVLKTVSMLKMSGMNRSAAIWTAGRLRPIATPLMKRLVVQATTPVVPGEMGEMLFELDETLCSCTFALVQCARDDEAVKPFLETVLKAHELQVPEGHMLPEGVLLLPSAELREYARQARAYWNGARDIKQMPRPTNGMSFSYRRYKPIGR
ncbi:MAG: HEAT repeat domain-containing protein [Lentisphaeria bacterium]|nr:HEAT repeat domain-containing protein [Lentisphaeria bacterium]